MGEWFNTEKVFSDNGGKIKKFAKGLYLVYLVVYLIAGAGAIILGFSDVGDFGGLIFAGAFVIILAQPLAYLSTCFIHGFGELVSNSYKNGGSDRGDETVQAEKIEEVKVETPKLDLSKYKNIGYFVAIFILWYVTIFESIYTSSLGGALCFAIGKIGLPILLTSIVYYSIPFFTIVLLSYCFFRKNKTKNKLFINIAVLLAGISVCIISVLWTVCVVQGYYLFFYYLLNFFYLANFIVLYILGKRIK